jgi:hypothetical protein
MPLIATIVARVARQGKVFAMSAFWKMWWTPPRRPPWQSGPTLLSVLRQWDGRQPIRFLDDTAVVENAIGIASDAEKGVSPHDSDRADAHSNIGRVQIVLDSLTNLVRKNDDKRRIALYEIAMKVPMSRYGDQVLDALKRQSVIGAKDVRPHARWLVHHAAHCEPLRLGILLLGLAGTKDDTADLQVIAKHDAFARFAAMAMNNLLGDIVANP